MQPNDGPLGNNALQAFRSSDLDDEQSITTGHQYPRGDVFYQMRAMGETVGLITCWVCVTTVSMSTSVIRSV
jgi:hypothetical protein